ncbi:hypothetical protein [Peribacillus sp. SCS-155]|uniref:hypothetical protein n=1 Tax=Peribacillus sedimenti TaxID=3115297 RepID=UPI003905BEE5
MSEDEYYEALLDLKKAYPVEIDKLQLMDTEKNKLEMEALKVSSFPAIVVISKEGEITRTISGDKETRQAITKAVSDAIEINQKSTLTSR